MNVLNCNKTEVLKCGENINSNELLEKYSIMLNALNNCADILCITTIDGYMTYLTPSCTKVLGYELEELMGKCIFQFIHENYIKIFKKEFKDMLIHNKEKNIRLLFKNKNDDFVWLEGLYKCIFDSNERICGVMFSLRDIEKQVQYEKKLNESEEKFRKLVDLMPYGVYIIKHENILYCNDIGLKYFKCEDQESILHKNILDFVIPHPDYEADFYTKTIPNINNGFLPLTKEKFIRKKDNKIIELETIITDFAYKDDQSKIVVTRDITNEMNAKDLSKKIEEKDKLIDETLAYDKLRAEFFANISHELRTPINVMYSALQLLNLELTKECESFNENSKLYKRMDTIKQNCFRLMRLINNLIDSTKIDSGYYKLELVKCNIVSVVENITLSVAEFVESKGLYLIFDTDVEEKLIFCDPDKIERIILNLISNSAKFTEKGGILVKIKDKQDHVLISVKDTGIGVPKEKINTIFQRFIQTDKKLKGEKEGSGIGLSLVNSLVAMHGGEIFLKSKAGKGSKFTIKLPCKNLEYNNVQDNISIDDVSNPLLLDDKIEKFKIELSDIYI